ncbi:hypothetical protein [Myxococcus sp. AB056]|uniref:hypothetical protein n=1 Tax=Myxococcus sp. AB056 TaxID=2562792 RepID=UPI0011473E46|nr:hypothetical protein [Myxococcus sp. AB056]
MSYLELVKVRLQIALDEQEREAFTAIEEIQKSLGGSGVTSVERQLAAAVDIFASSLEDTVRTVINGLRSDSLQLGQADFADLWGAAKSCFPEELNVRARRFLSVFIAREGGVRDSERLAHQMSHRLGQRTSRLVVDIHNRAKECDYSRKLLVPPSRQVTREVIMFVEEVSALVRSQGDVAGFIEKSTSQLERIETEVRRQGMDISFAADALAESMVKKLTTRDGLSQFIGGVSTNAAYDAIKNVAAALIGLAGS